MNYPIQTMQAIDSQANQLAITETKKHFEVIEEFIHEPIYTMSPEAMEYFKEVRLQEVEKLVAKLIQC